MIIKLNGFSENYSKAMRYFLLQYVVCNQKTDGRTQLFNGINFKQKRKVQTFGFSGILSF